ncbi:TonB family protein [Flammeovirgaceae bacterium SG7u.111]|nr:TonB family protein [Flammeovirgaceae bacterium SG7u.132]WPO37841.1 TonB family protein [Flammeovirgaceae bacterium SG7u.111]
MKKTLLIVSVCIISFAFMAFGFTNRSEVGDVSNKDVLLYLSKEIGDKLTFDPSAKSVTMPNEPGEKVFSYQVQGRYARAITKAVLKDAKSLKDIIPYYPSSWISNYQSVVISTSRGGKDIAATSLNEVLSVEQIALLQSLGLEDDLQIKVNYKNKNEITGELRDQLMEVAMTVVPEKEAEFASGYDQMINYLKENSKDKISVKMLENLQTTFVLFTVNEQGNTEGVHLSESTGDAEIDKALVELVEQMPKWKPAENSKGVKVKQKFQFTFRAPSDNC